MDEKHYNFLKNKSIESFLLSIEIFNKPTINYRLEGCVFFLCNAWELMLKAKLLKENISIYYPNSGRTLSLNDAAAKIMTNKKDPVRVNLNIITTLRNTATHDIIPEFEIVYMPFLTFCVKSYADKMYDYLGVNISKYIKTDFLSLFTNNRTINESEILSSYGENIKNIFDSKISSIKEVIDENPDMSIGYNVVINLARINNKSKADFTFYASKNPKDTNVKYIDRYLDPNETHSLTYHMVINEVDKTIKRENIPFTPIRNPVKSKRNPNPNIFTNACFDTLNKEFDFKGDSEFCRQIKNGNSMIYKYSEALVTKIITLILEDKDIIIKLREKQKK